MEGRPISLAHTDGAKGVSCLASCLDSKAANWLDVTPQVHGVLDTSNDNPRWAVHDMVLMPRGEGALDCSNAKGHPEIASYTCMWPRCTLPVYDSDVPDNTEPGEKTKQCTCTYGYSALEVQKEEGTSRDMHVDLIAIIL